MEITIYLSLGFLLLYALGLVLHRIKFVRDRRRMRLESRLGRRVVARVEEVAPGTVKKFWLICEKYRVDGFVVNDGGEFHAYVNRCRHMPTPLDFVRDEFFSADGRHLMCYTHGALYEPATGFCVSGPCQGQSLYRLPVTVDRGEVLVGCPEGDLSFLKD
ncbi:MAG TPA: Rieske 2Fe-2S domain-containing protein [candidate division Zixibacteria bacterium]|nr:Rieske 2Fe-2S domain-containing protein [candidate division Zixibacteria bacterium]